MQTWSVTLPVTGVVLGAELATGIGVPVVLTRIWTEAIE